MEENKREVHDGIACDGCDCAPIIGERWRCVDCVDDFSFCKECYEGVDGLQHRQKGHRLFIISPPWDIEEVRRSMARTAIDFLKDDMLVRANKEKQVADQNLEEQHNDINYETKLRADAVCEFIHEHMQHLTNVQYNLPESPYWSSGFE